MAIPVWLRIRLFTCAVPLILIAAGVAGATPQDGGNERTATLALSAGRDTYRQFCAPCHGQDGKGRGLMADILVTPPADLTQVKRRNNGMFPLVTLEAMLMLATRLQTSTHGSEQMPIWGPAFRAIDGSPALSHARVANLLAYLESIQQL